MFYLNCKYLDDILLNSFSSWRCTKYLPMRDKPQTMNRDEIMWLILKWGRLPLKVWWCSIGAHLHFIYSNELEVNPTADTQTSASYIDLHIEIDNGVRLKTRLQQTWYIHFSYSSITICELHQRMEFLFLNFCVNLELC